MNLNDGYSGKEASNVFVPSCWLRLNSPVVDLADRSQTRLILCSEYNDAMSVHTARSTDCSVFSIYSPIKIKSLI